jgi:hypothetical protein
VIDAMPLFAGERRAARGQVQGGLSILWLYWALTAEHLWTFGALTAEDAQAVAALEPAGGTLVMAVYDECPWDVLIEGRPMDLRRRDCHPEPRTVMPPELVPAAELKADDRAFSQWAHGCLEGCDRRPWHDRVQEGAPMGACQQRLPFLAHLAIAGFRYIWRDLKVASIRKGWDSQPGRFVMTRMKDVQWRT